MKNLVKTIIAAALLSLLMVPAFGADYAWKPVMNATTTRYTNTYNVEVQMKALADYVILNTATVSTNTTTNVLYVQFQRSQDDVNWEDAYLWSRNVATNLNGGTVVLTNSALFGARHLRVSTVGLSGTEYKSLRVGFGYWH